RRDSGSRGGFMWTKNGEDMLLSVDELIQSYCTSVGRNANMLLGMVIDTAGLCPEPDVKRLREFGAKIREVFSNPLAQTGGKGDSFTLDLKRPQMVNYVVIKEDLAGGERVRRYEVEVWGDGSWKKVCDGISVGHERIQQFEAVRTSKLRLTIKESEGAPAIKSFSAFRLE
ncbi:MAG TPA: discoidin domain-containing protein, partial [Puia sp.]|nr:discoidin domain-containing protein [Puia sp.]